MQWLLYTVYAYFSQTFCVLIRVFYYWLVPCGGYLISTAYCLFFSSPEPKAHWWAYRIPMDPASVVRPSTFSNIFSSETAWPIKAKFYVEPPWEGGTKVYINSPGHMTKMAAMPIYGKNLNLLLQNRRVNFHETWYVASETPAHHSLYKWWPWSDLDLFYGKVKFGTLGFSIGKNENSGFFRNYWSLWPESW